MTQTTVTANDTTRGEKIAHSGKYNGTTYADEPPWEPPGDEPQGDGDRSGGTTLSDEPRLPFYANQLLTRAALRTLPNPEPLIANVIDRGTVALLYGKWGSGKSFVALDWAACVATGKPWQNRPTTKVKVLYIAAEGAFGMKQRAEAWEQAWHTEIADDHLTILPTAVNLTSPIVVRELVKLIKWGGYGLVILDTLARCMVGGDENSAKDCGLVVDALTQMREATPGGRGVVLGVHHTGKDGKTFRGSSVFEAGADTVYSLTPEQESAAIVLDREKRKDGPQDDKHTVFIDPIPGTGSAVISARNLSTWGVDKPERAQRLLSTFVHHFTETGASKADLRKVADMADATFFRAVSDLVKAGDIINIGTEKRPFYKATVK